MSLLERNIYVIQIQYSRIVYERFIDFVVLIQETSQ